MVLLFFQLNWKIKNKKALRIQPKRENWEFLKNSNDWRKTASSLGKQERRVKSETRKEKNRTVIQTYPKYCLYLTFQSNHLPFLLYTIYSTDTLTNSPTLPTTRCYSNAKIKLNATLYGRLTFTYPSTAQIHQWNKF